MGDHDAGSKGLFFQIDAKGSDAEEEHDKGDMAATQNLQAIAFASLSAEGDLLFKHGEYQRAIASYNRVSLSLSHTCALLVALDLSFYLSFFPSIFFLSSVSLLHLLSCQLLLFFKCLSLSL
eukprot:TRINITY_DN9798_c0_g1_i2.p1 TRINITY_DN9798_c0_g1~~TRINITY_DN9798_c0_g1_i2.p1  ORF type:complete len:122 (+),score=24.10 TRINITY_DN9798_c0_g1_i2:62-427(+)